MARERRRWSRILQLPADVIREVNQALLRGEKYEDIANNLQARGFAASRSAVGRYGKDFLDRFGQLKLVHNQVVALAGQEQPGAGKPGVNGGQLSLQLMLDMLTQIVELRQELMQAHELMGSLAGRLENLSTSAEQILDVLAQPIGGREVS